MIGEVDLFRIVFFKCRIYKTHIHTFTQNRKKGGKQFNNMVRVEIICTLTNDLIFGQKNESFNAFT